MISLLMAVFFPTLPVMNGAPGEMFTPKSDSVYVVEAYFNTCPYCNYNAKKVDALAEEFKDYPRLHVLDVGVDRKDSDYKSWIAKHSPNHPVLKDDSKVLIKQLGTKSYPSTYVINCLGTVVFQTSGEWSSKTVNKIREAVNSVLEMECGPTSPEPYLNAPFRLPSFDHMPFENH